MNTNVESLVFSMMTFSATFPGATKESESIRDETKQTHKVTVAMTADTHTSSDHCDRRLDVDPFVCVNTRVDEYQAVKVRLLAPSESILNGVIVLEKTSHGELMTGVLK